ncbi:hypothetical protein JQC92_12900, partial [Shewanella sp. 202IG2-18]|uniref:hypothetical protein n=1 Tax=Parashewanella hymeniacidonis TaxID=2807618 RepID=UPI001960EDA7
SISARMHSLLIKATVCGNSELLLALATQSNTLCNSHFVDFLATILLCYISSKESRYSFANAPQRIGAEKVLKHASSGIMGIVLQPKNSVEPKKLS